MSFKKVSSVILIFAMLISALSFTALAADEILEVTYENITNPGSVIEVGDMFFAVVTLKGAESFAMVQFKLLYDTSKVQLSRADGNIPTNFNTSVDAGTKLDNSLTYSDPDETGWEGNPMELNSAIVDTENGIVTYAVSTRIFDGTSYYAYPLTNEQSADGLTVVKIRFKALAEGNSGFEYDTSFSKMQLEMGGLWVDALNSNITPLTISGGDPDPVTYTVTYDANGAAGAAPTQEDLEEDDTFIVASADGLTLAGKQFVEWNTQDDGEGVSYAPGATFTMGAANVTLYAIWEDVPAEKYTVTYDANGAAGAVPTQEDLEAGQTFIVASAAGLTLAGKQFVEWNTQDDGEGVSYAPGATFTMGAANVILYAIWEDVPPTYYTLSKGTATNGTLVFDPANGIVEAGQSVEVIATPDPGYEFVAFTGASTSTTSPETIIMDGNKTIGATFQLISTVEPTMILGSQVAYRGTTITVPVSVKNVPTGIAGINFSVGYEPSAFEYLNITLNNSLLQENGIDTATGAVAVAAILQDGVNLEDDAIIANISFAVKADAELGDEFLTLYNVVYGALPVTNFVGGKITISVATDPNLPAAIEAVQAYKEAPLTSIALVEVAEGLEQDALDAIDELDPDLSEIQIISLTAEVELHAGIVAAARARFEAEAEAVALVVAYETGDLNTLENVAIAEGKRAAAVTAVGLLTSSDVDFVAALNTRISDRDTEIAEAREALEKANALNDVNAGTFVIADLISLGVNNTQVDKLNQYKVAVIAAKAFNGTILAEGDLQDIITAANGVDLDTDLGYVRGEFANKVLALDAACAKDHLMSRRVKGSMTVADFVKEAIRADMDKNGVIDAGDITDILVMSANQNLVQD